MLSGKIFDLCKSLSEGQKFKPLEYNQFIKNPKILNHVAQDKEVINKLYKMLKASELSKIERTKSGGIKKHNIHHWCGAWDAREYHTKRNVFMGVVITVILFDYVFVFKCGNFRVEGSDMNGKKAFSKLHKECENNHIDLDKYATDNGAEIKQQIESPIIRLNSKYQGFEVENVHHLDYNSAWPAGCADDYPELLPVFKRLREQDKLIGDMALGYCQSEWVDYKFAKLAKSGINNTNRKIKLLMFELIKQKFDVVCINTDGIWYKDATNENRIYTDSNEGCELGQWKTDHKNCTFYGYSDGQYYFIEDGKFTPRARGHYSYEVMKPRNEWDKEDFFKAMQTQVMITWDENEGFVIL